MASVAKGLNSILLNLNQSLSLDSRAYLVAIILASIALESGIGLSAARYKDQLCR